MTVAEAIPATDLLQALRDAGVSLYGAHASLDSHPEFSNSSSKEYHCIICTFVNTCVAVMEP